MPSEARSLRFSNCVILAFISPATAAHAACELCGAGSDVTLQLTKQIEAILGAQLSATETSQHAMCLT
jgi:uncharacterized ferredoxin-like protein